jgi:hypothetical protein
MTHKALLRRPGGFLGLFALVTALSLLAWDVLPAYYLQAIIWLVNGGLVLLNPATVLRLPASLLHDGVYLGIAGAIALFLVTPRQTWRWRLRWMGLLMAVMLALHAAVLLAETMNAIQGLSTAPLPLRLARTWGTSTVVIWVWFVAVRRPAPPPVDITPRSAGG